MQVDQTAFPSRRPFQVLAFSADKPISHRLRIPTNRPWPLLFLLFPTISCLGSEERPDRPVGLTVRYSTCNKKNPKWIRF